MGSLHHNGTNGNTTVASIFDRYAHSLAQHAGDPLIPLDRPEILQLADVLCGEGYTCGARTSILRQAAADGHLEGCPYVDQADRELRHQLAIIDSMTVQERRQSGIIDGSRRRRIAAGAGVQVQDVNRLLKQFMDMQRLMKGMKGMKGGQLGRLMSGLSGKLPPGVPRRR